ncbi:MAG: YihY/virulence factor BrkB family protein [Oscillospiraceae bacterium]|nr:YihY/virulence factor BrkB family protein [Oscillospiraceae bacterium]MCR5306651.1 YihY/virulence factor BrkB family protein [Oscillospiraceae bacterium]
MMQVLRRILRMLKTASGKTAQDHLSAYAAQATFYLMLAAFPFTMLVCLATRLLPVREETLLRAVRLLLPENYRSIGEGFIDSYFNKNIGSAKLVLILFLIWTASRLIQALMNGFNTVYGIKETRSQATLRLIGCLYTVATCIILVTLIVMYALGSRLVELMLMRFPEFPLLDLILNITRNLASPVLLFLVFWLSYALLPSRRARFREELPGALLSAVFWRGAAALYTVFLERSLSRYAYVYGSLTGVVMILVWLYVCMYFWFLGAELNWYLKQRREKGTLPAPLEKYLYQPNRYEKAAGDDTVRKD